jgi:hypothetical protein
MEKFDRMKQRFILKYYFLGSIKQKSKSKAIPVTGRGGLFECETSRLPNSLDNRLTDGGVVFSLTSRPLFTSPFSRKIPGTHFY